MDAVIPPGFPASGLDVSVIAEGVRHVVDRYRAASALSRSFSTWKPAINGVERLGGPAASDRVLGDRAWPQLAALLIPVLAFYGVIPGANLPVEVFALASTLLILLPTALWVTSITDGRAGVRSLFARVFVGGSALVGGWWCCLAYR